MDSDNFKTKEAKIRFLTEIIVLIGICEGEPTKVNPVKIVAGLNATQTNNFLTRLGKVALDPMIDKNAAVELCLAGQVPGKCRRPLIGLTQSTVESSGEKIIESNRNNLVSPKDDNHKLGVDAPDSSLAIPEFEGLSTRERLNLCNSSIAQIKAWIAAIGVKKPKCTDKLLSRPPFRFLHDLIIALVSQTGFQLRGLT